MSAYSNLAVKCHFIGHGECTKNNRCTRPVQCFAQARPATWHLDSRSRRRILLPLICHFNSPIPNAALECTSAFHACILHATSRNACFSHANVHLAHAFASNKHASCMQYSHMHAKSMQNTCAETKCMLNACI